MSAEEKRARYSSGSKRRPAPAGYTTPFQSSYDQPAGGPLGQVNMPETSISAADGAGSFAALGIERPKLRNQLAIANQNTLIYILINLRAMQRLAKQSD